MKKLLLLLLLPLFANAQIFSEDFESGIPSTWTLAGDGNWGTTTVAWEDAIFESTVAYFDDDAAGDEVIVSNAQLISPVIDLSNYESLSLTFDYGNYIFIDETSLTVQVFDGTEWITVFEAFGDQFEEDTYLPLNTTIDITPYANSQFQVRFVYNDVGDWSFGAVVDNIVVDGVLGLRNNNANRMFSISPNPATDYFELTSSAFSDQVMVQLTDVSGKSFKISGINGRFDISTLQSGVYILKISNNTKVETVKLLKR